MSSVTLSVGTDFACTLLATQSLSNKSFVNGSDYFVDSTDSTKKIGFQTSGATTATTTTLASAQTANRVLTLPDSTDTIAGVTTTQTFTNKTLTAPIISTIVNGSATLTLPSSSSDTLVGQATSATLTNKSLVNANCFFVDGADNTKKIGFLDSAATTGTTLTLAGQQTVNRTITFPDATDTVVTLAATQTLTNKTVDTNNNTIAMNGTNLTSIIAPTNPLLATSTPTFSNLNLTGTTFSLLNGHEIHQYFTTSSTNTTAVTVLTIAVASNSSMTLSTVCNAYCTTGTDAAKSMSFRLTSKVKNVSGTVSAVTTESFINNDGFSAAVPTLLHTASSGNILVQFTGNSADTITVTGVSISYI